MNTPASHSRHHKCVNMTKLKRGARDVGDSTAGLSGNLRPWLSSPVEEASRLIRPAACDGLASAQRGMCEEEGGIEKRRDGGWVGGGGINMVDSWDEMPQREEGFIRGHGLDPQQTTGRSLGHPVQAVVSSDWLRCLLIGKWRVTGGPPTRTLQPELGLLIRHPCNRAGAPIRPAVSAVKNGNTTHANHPHACGPPLTTVKTFKPSICSCVPSCTPESDATNPLVYLWLLHSTGFLEFLQYADSCCVLLSGCDIELLLFLFTKKKSQQTTWAFQPVSELKRN